ncbi:periphilin-1 isoform 1 [Lynx pardinus]|uniref:Periphilin-1 isoform 1 n=1 Tax=Lynx pardinus TaxID=191816 RepID=A0A485MTF3_LYNPA|nr:periphilin-1 isoform 1 [Lynx pardinus]
MWSEGRYDYERLPRERVPPRSHPSDESGYRWTRDDHSTSRQPEYRDMRDGFRRKSFYPSHYARDRSPHKRDPPFFRESPVGRKDSPHSRSGSSVSSRSYSPERSKTYSFHQSQHRSKERPVQSLKTSRDTSPSSSSAVPSSKVCYILKISLKRNYKVNEMDCLVQVLLFFTVKLNEDNLLHLNI